MYKIGDEVIILDNSDFCKTVRNRVKNGAIAQISNTLCYDNMVEVVFKEFDYDKQWSQVIDKSEIVSAGTLAEYIKRRLG